MNLMSKDISADFPESDKIYLNNAAISIMPSLSIDEMKDFLVSYNSTGPDSKDAQSLVDTKIQSLRRIISDIISCHPDEVVLTQSTTDGINMVANGLSFGTDSNIIIRGMAHEHHSNLYPWLKLGHKTELRSLEIDNEDGFFNLDDLESFLDNNTRLVALSHALYNTGSILPVQNVGDIIDGRMPFFIDSAQTVGCIDDVDVSKIKCDFMAFNGSKWLCGPMGMGLFYCRKESSHMLEPAVVGGESATLDDNDVVFKDPPDKFQTGFRNYAGVVGLESSAKYLQKFGIDNICKKNQYLSTALRDELDNMPNITLYGPDSSIADRTSIVSFNVDGFEAANVVARLEEQNIILAVREIIDKTIVRVSPHFFNTESEIVTVVDAIKNL